MKGTNKGAFWVLIGISALFVEGCAGPDSAGIAGAGVPIPLPGTYKFKIDSEPPGAEIFFNGQHKGTAPLAWERTLLFQTIQTITIEGFYPGSLSVGKVSGNNYGQRPKVEGGAQTRQWGSPATHIVFRESPNSFVNYGLVSPAMTKLVLALAATNNAFLATNTALPVLHFIMEASTNQALKAKVEARLTAALEESEEANRFIALITFAADPRTNAFSMRAAERVSKHINEWAATSQSEKIETLLRAANEDGLKQWIAAHGNASGMELLAQALQAAQQLITNKSEAITAEDYARNFTVDGTLLSVLVSEIKQKRQLKDEKGVRISYSENLIAPSWTVTPQDETGAKSPPPAVIEDTFTGGGISYRRQKYKNLGITYESVKRQGRANGLTVSTQVYTLDGKYFRRSEIEGLSNIN